jgi:hypothetical protein
MVNTTISITAVKLSIKKFHAIFKYKILNHIPKLMKITFSSKKITIQKK